MTQMTIVRNQTVRDGFRPNHIYVGCTFVTPPSGEDGGRYVDPIGQDVTLISCRFVTKDEAHATTDE
jgi:hypothetical protein